MRTIKIIALVLLAGCGKQATNGQNEVVPTTVAVEVPPPTTYLFYKGPGYLNAVDAQDGTATTVAATATPMTGLVSIPFGDYDAKTHTLRRMHERTLVFGKDGRLWKLSALRDGGLTQTQISNESGIGTTGICASFFAADYADHNNSRYVYRLAGANGICDNTDDVWKMVRIGMDASESPLISTGNIDYAIAQLRDPDTGALTGWLRMIGSAAPYALVRFDANFLHAVTVTSSMNYISNLAYASDGHVALLVNNAVVLYDPASYPTPNSGLSAPLYSVSSGSLGAPASDGEHLYAAGGADVVDITLRAGVAPVVLTSETGRDIGGIVLTPTRVVYVSSKTTPIPASPPAAATSQTISALKSIPRSGGTSQLLVTAAPEEAIGVGSRGVQTAGEWIYYNRTIGSPFDQKSFVHTAGAVRSDGSGLMEHASAYWTGWLNASSTLIYGGRPKTRMLLRDTSTVLNTLQGYDATTHTLLATLGQIPADFTQLYFAGVGSADAILGHGTDAATSNNDVFYINASKANSLARLTTTPDTSERVIGGGCSVRNANGVDGLYVFGLLWLAGQALRRYRRR